ncbi:hypothetical protein [Deinococcus multiflagellatus]|uniref:hypothetical protein n=1 Tax=Deinococcus multiflagellatus TaxID=1656887 RepID=UPI0021E34758|nr:hypothetical protein [Deinococcus multiflagellatus]
MLAHEVTHTVQQSQGRVGTGIDPDAGLEREARTMGARLAVLPAPPGPRAAQRVQQKAPPQRTQAVQRQTAAANPPLTAEQHVKAFQAKLKQAALKTLGQNEQRLISRQKAMARTSPDNPAWAALHLVAQKNVQVERTWQSLVGAVEKQVLAAGSDAARPFTNPALRLRLSDQQDGLMQLIYLNWSRTRAAGLQPPTSASTAAQLQQFRQQYEPLLRQFDQLARVEDARDYLHAQYPEVALLAKKLGATGLAASPNTAAANARLGGLLNEEYSKTRKAIADLRARIQGGHLPTGHMDVLLYQVMQQEGIQPGATTAKSRAVTAWLEGQSRTNLWTDIGLTLAALGFTIAALLAPEFVLVGAAALASTATLTTRNLLSSQAQRGVSNTQAMGGQALSSVSPEAAQAQVVLAQVDALLLGAGVVAAGAAGLKNLGPLASSVQGLSRGSRYRWAAGEVNTGRVAGTAANASQDARLAKFPKNEWPAVKDFWPSIRARQDDVPKIAKLVGMSEEQVLLAKQHLIMRDHLMRMDDGIVRVSRFEPNADMLSYGRG